jgi:hypothetical protein
MKDFFVMFFSQLCAYLLITINIRAIAHSNYAWTARLSPDLCWVQLLAHQKNCKVREHLGLDRLYAWGSDRLYAWHFPEQVFGIGRRANGVLESMGYTYWVGLYDVGSVCNKPRVWPHFRRRYHGVHCMAERIKEAT